MEKKAVGVCLRGPGAMLGSHGRGHLAPPMGPRRRVHLVKAVVSPVVMYGCESWTINKTEHWKIYAFELWCWRRLLSPLDCKEIQPVHPKGNQSWIVIGRTDAEAEVPILWPPLAKNWLIWKDPDAGKDWSQEKEMREDEMVGWHHWLNGHEFEPALGVGDGREAWYAAVHGVVNSWSRLSDWTELNLHHFRTWLSVPRYLSSIHECMAYIKPPIFFSNSLPFIMRTSIKNTKG